MRSNFWITYVLFLCAQVVTSQVSEIISGVRNDTNTNGNSSQGLIIEGSTEVAEDEDNVSEYVLDNIGFEDKDDKNITVSWEDYDGGIALESQSHHYSVFNLQIRLSFRYV